MGNRIASRLLRCCAAPIETTNNSMSVPYPEATNESTLKRVYDRHPLEVVQSIPTQKPVIRERSQENSEGYLMSNSKQTHAQKYSEVTLDEENQIVELVKSKPAGAYLVYSPNNNGSWTCVWCNQYKEDAWAFIQPENKLAVPAYKFYGKPEILATGINSSNESLCLGWIEFFKIARRINGKIALLPRFLHPEPDDLFTDLLFVFHIFETGGVHNRAANSFSGRRVQV